MVRRIEHRLVSGGWAGFSPVSSPLAQPSTPCRSAHLRSPSSSPPATIPRDGARLGGERAGGHGSCEGHPRAGHFNCRFTQPNDRVWADLDEGEPANADLTRLTPDLPVSCRDKTFTAFIDHLVVERRVVPWVDRTSFRQVTYRQADKAVWDRLSDHYPVLVELWIR
jgi:hypothetical protein